MTKETKLNPKYVARKAINNPALAIPGALASAIGGAMLIGVPTIHSTLEEMDTVGSASDAVQEQMVEDFTSSLHTLQSTKYDLALLDAQIKHDQFDGKDLAPLLSEQDDLQNSYDERAHQLYTGLFAGDKTGAYLPEKQVASLLEKFEKVQSPKALGYEPDLALGVLDETLMSEGGNAQDQNLFSAIEKTKQITNEMADEQSSDGTIQSIGIGGGMMGGFVLFMAMLLTITEKYRHEPRHIQRRRPQTKHNH